MRRLLMGFAACTLIMTSCSNNETFETVSDGQGQLTFAAGTAQQGTRAAELDNTTVQSNSITLYAYEKVPATGWKKWYNDVVEYSGGKWALKTSVRFRNANETKYITYSSKASSGATLTPDAASFTNADFKATGAGGTIDDAIDKFPKFTYTVATDSKTQEDLIAGITDVGANKTDITLGLRHILSQVNFGTVGYKGAKIQIQNIQIKGVKNKADFRYKADNIYPIGDWINESATTTNYEYYNNTNEKVAAKDDDKANPHALVPASAVSGDKYIFGDGGNAGPGNNANTWYPTSKSDKTWKNNFASPTGLDNSLMLLPQTLGTSAKVTFEYKIQDVDNAYAAGGPTAADWAQGEFSLNFSTGTNVGNEAKYYDSKWEQNYRYVYLIDFTDFLDGIALTFKVDVETYKWENYNKDDENNGIVNIMAAGQPSQANMNAATFGNGDTWYIASQSETSPNDISFIKKKWAQVMRNETWDLSAYDFAQIDATETFVLNFENVIFNTHTVPSAGTPTQIDMKLPAGYSATASAEIDLSGTAPNYTVKMNEIGTTGEYYREGTLTITNNSVYNKTTTLAPKILALSPTGTTISYKGTAAVNLTAMDNTALTTTGNTINVKFTSLIIPTVGTTTNGIWTWDGTTKIATWTKVDWKALAATGTAFTDATGASTTIYCNDATTDLSATFATVPPALVNSNVVNIVFNNAASRTFGTSNYGTWSYNNTTNTATFTRNDVLTLLAAQASISAATANLSIKCGDDTAIDLDNLGDPSDTGVNKVTVVFSKAANRIVGGTTPNGTWAYDSATNTATWTKTIP